MPDNTLLWLRGCVFLALLLAASVADLKNRIIPDSICIAITLTGLFPFEPVRLAGIIWALPMLIIALIFGKVGGGDIKLMAASGCVLGMDNGFTAIFLGLNLMLLFHAARRAACRSCVEKRPKSYPLVPFLSAGCAVAYFLNPGGISNI